MNLTNDKITNWYLSFSLLLFGTFHLRLQHGVPSLQRHLLPFASTVHYRDKLPRHQFKLFFTVKKTLSFLLEKTLMKSEDFSQQKTMTKLHLYLTELAAWHSLLRESFSYLKNVLYQFPTLRYVFFASTIFSSVMITSPC